MDDMCPCCNCSIYPDDEVVYFFGSAYHLECAEQFEFDDDDNDDIN